MPLMLDTLRIMFGHFDEENRLIPMLKMMSFKRLDKESFAEMLTRFDIVREDSENEAAFFLSIEACAMIIVRNVKLDVELFIKLFKPLGMRLPRTQVEFDNLIHEIRKEMTIRENEPGNLRQILDQMNNPNYVGGGKQRRFFRKSKIVLSGH